MTDYFKQWAQEGLPVINWHYRWSILWSNNLCNIDRFLCTALDACAKLLQTGYWSSPKCFLQQAEATVGRKLSVFSNQEVEWHSVVKTIECSPHQICQNKVIFVLATAVITVQINFPFS